METYYGYYVRVSLDDVLSPPCGMETSIWRTKFCKRARFWAHRVGWRQVTMILQKVKNLGSEPTVWDGDSPLLPTFPHVSCCSEPTVWDGDFSSKANNLCRLLCSKPTVWDGDTVLLSLPEESTPLTFQAHRVGWRPAICIVWALIHHCSKPTVWDGE